MTQSDLVSYQDIFSAVADLAWNPHDLRKSVAAHEGTDMPDPSLDKEIVAKISRYLRALTVEEMEKYLASRPADKVAQWAGILGEDVTEYLKRAKGTYSGDLLCLYFLAQRMTSNFRVWLPGKNQCIAITTLRSRGAGHFNIAVTDDPEKEMDMDVDSMPKAAVYKKRFFPIIKATHTRSKGVSFSTGSNVTSPIPAENRGTKVPPRNQSAQRALGLPKPGERSRSPSPVRSSSPGAGPSGR